MKLQAKSGNKITDKNRTFFNDFIYVPDNYNFLSSFYVFVTH